MRRIGAPNPNTKEFFMKNLQSNRALKGWLMVSPLALVLFFFLVLPIILIVVVSFWRATEFSIIPAFEWDNYEFLFGSPVTYKVFANTFKYAFITWVFTLFWGPMSQIPAVAVVLTMRTNYHARTF